MTTQINKHVFHGFYSNFGYRPQFSIDRKLANFPIHFYRASYGEKEGGTIKEFKTEEEVLKWYKKNKYGESQFNKLEFPKDICKNYIVFSDSEFYKYRHLFHGMIKGLKVTSDIDLELEGTTFSPECSQCKKDVREGVSEGSTAGPIVFNSPDGRPTYFDVTGGADDIGYLNGIKITDGTLASSFNPDLIPKTPQSTLSFTATDTVGVNVAIEATVTWYKKIEYKQKINFKIDFDSTKIFDFEQLQKRLPATNFGYQTIINLEEDENIEELTSFSGKKVFKEEWEFDQKEFKSIFENEKEKFNYNATFINDPVILPESESDGAPGISGPGTPGISGPSNLNFQKMSISSLKTLMTEIKIQNSATINDSLHITIENKFNRDGGEYSEETVNKQKNFSKKFEKFNSIEYKFDNSNSIINSADHSLKFIITDLFYIKEKKSYLCFIEIENELLFDSRVIHKKEDCPDSECEDLSPSSSSSSDDNSSSSSDDNNSSSGSSVGGQDFINLALEVIDSYYKNSFILSASNEYIDLGRINIFNAKIPLLTTNDIINDNDSRLTYMASDCENEPKKVEFEKTKCKIKLINNNYEIEIFKLKDASFSFNNSECEDLPRPSYNKEIEHNVKVNYNNTPGFEILEWKDSDFNKANVFPPKLT